MMNKLIENIFIGEQKYTVGIIFMFANLAGFFLNMRKLKIDDSISISILVVFTLVARCIV